jgi:8-oxo-dGTP pyrophosphatase MutT (NUDIX family)
MQPFDDHIRQAAALPLRGSKACIITSSNGKRWVIPKGLIEPGQTAGETALQEAWEEAGLVGTLHPEPIGSYIYEKYGNTYHVIVFVMEVTEATAEWPEQDLRRRTWVSRTALFERIAEPGLLEVLRFALERHYAAT